MAHEIEYGVVVILRGPHDERNFRVCFDTVRSQRARAANAMALETLSREDQPIERRVSALFRTLQTNLHHRLADNLPPGLDDWADPVDNGLRVWIAGHPNHWRVYRRWLDDNGRDLEWLAAQHGLCGVDLPIRTGYSDAPVL